MALRPRNQAIAICSCDSCDLPRFSDRFEASSEHVGDKKETEPPDRKEINKNIFDYYFEDYFTIECMVSIF